MNFFTNLELACLHLLLFSGVTLQCPSNSTKFLGLELEQVLLEEACRFRPLYSPLYRPLYLKELSVHSQVQANICPSSGIYSFCSRILILASFEARELHHFSENNQDPHRSLYSPIDWKMLLQCPQQDLGFHDSWLRYVLQVVLGQYRKKCYPVFTSATLFP